MLKVLIRWGIKGLRTKAAAPVNNFYPQKKKKKKKKKKKRRKKKKNIAVLLGGRIGLSRFLRKILHGACESVEIFSQNP